MSDYQAIIINVFTRLRRSGFVLGVHELLAALELLDERWTISSADELRDDLQLLWCHSRLEEDRLQDVWKAALVTSAPSKPLEKTTPPLEPERYKPDFKRD